MKIEPDIDAFEEALRRLTELQGKTMREVVLDQSALFCRDGIQLLPPFGRTPLREGASVQKSIGFRATGRQVNRLFRGMDTTWAVRNPEINEAFKRLARKKNAVGAENFLKRIGFKRVAGVVEHASEELHNRGRNKKGRVERGGSQWFTFKASSVDRLRKLKEKAVGRAKAGFLFAMSAIDSLRGRSTIRIPAFVARHRGEPGSFQDLGADDRYGVVVANLVPHAQKHNERVEREGWRARMFMAPRQAEKLYRAMARKANQLKV